MDEFEKSRIHRRRCLHSPLKASWSCISMTGVNGSARPKVQREPTPQNIARDYWLLAPATPVHNPKRGQPSRSHLPEEAGASDR